MTDEQMVKALRAYAVVFAKDPDARCEDVEDRAVAYLLREAANRIDALVKSSATRQPRAGRGPDGRRLEAA